MQFGMPNNPRRPPEEEIAWAARHGFDFLDLSLEPDRALPEQINPASIREAARQAGIGLIGHMAWFLPIGSPLAGLRQAGLDFAAAALETFGRIGVPRATIHTHWPSHLFSIEEGIAFHIESLERLLPIARKAGVRLMLEPAASRFDVPDHLEPIYEALPELECHLDLGHAHLNGTEPWEWIERFGPRITHIHAHDNNGRDDLHLPPGTGTIEWSRTLTALRTIGYDATLTIESFSPDRSYLLHALNRMKRWWATGSAESE
jgi:sugar phosphate isomerase/epimerase